MFQTEHAMRPRTSPAVPLPMPRYLEAVDFHGMPLVALGPDDDLYAGAVRPQRVRLFIKSQSMPMTFVSAKPD